MEQIIEGKWFTWEFVPDDPRFEPRIPHMNQASFKLFTKGHTKKQVGSDARCRIRPVTIIIGDPIDV
jgi:hypothetical protein